MPRATNNGGPREDGVGDAREAFLNMLADAFDFHVWSPVSSPSGSWLAATGRSVKSVGPRTGPSSIGRAIVMSVPAFKGREAELEERIRSLHEALTPSAETKAAYIGEFTIPWPVIGEDGDDHIIRINVPWTTIKEIMCAILGRAALAKARGEQS
jgi:hypothetical protein